MGSPWCVTPPSSTKIRLGDIHSPEKFQLSPTAASTESEPLALKKPPELALSPSYVSHEDAILEQVWGQVDELQKCMPVSNVERRYDTDSEDDDDEYTASRKEDSSVMAVLPCGDIHVCRVGRFCPYLEATEDRLMVCMYTGLEHGPEHTDEFFDLNGGIGKKSGDPDQNCGGVMHGKWTRRAEPVAASRMALQSAYAFDDDDTFGMFPAPEDVRTVKGVAKRGALCVGEETQETSARKRMRPSKKNVECYETVTNLHTEAEGVLTKLIDHKRTTSFKQKAPPGKVERKCAPPDPRMCDEHYVFRKSVEKYIKNFTVSGVAPSMNDIHNLSLMAKTVSADARKRQREAGSGANIRTAKFRMLCSSLIVSLWKAVCSTPYMANARRGTDAYRPFVCGVLYAFKRGVALENGMTLVPKCEPLADTLPVLRGTGGNTLAKTLHSSSHRGMCTLSRCIASVPKQEQSRVFRDVAQVALQFSSETFSKWDV